MDTKSQKKHLNPARILKISLLTVINIYQKYVSPLSPRHCKYMPTCSQYARECVERLPLHRALWHTFRRIISCNPWSTGGYDPVPNKKTSTSTDTFPDKK